MIKILHASVVTQMMLGGQLYIIQLLISYGVYVPKIMKVD